MQTVRDWMQAGGPTVLDDRTGMFDPLGTTVNALADLWGLPNVLVLQGINWYQSETERTRVGDFLDQHAALPYQLTQPAGDPDALLTVERMQAPNGDELAAVVRRGPSGATADRLAFTLNWRRAHGSFTVLDPFGQGVVRAHGRRRRSGEHQPHPPGIPTRGCRDPGPQGGDYQRGRRRIHVLPPGIRAIVPNETEVAVGLGVKRGSASLQGPGARPPTLSYANGLEARLAEPRA